MRTAVLLLIGFSGFATCVEAQPRGGEEVSATSTVSGHVYYADTNGPARMATVVLQPAQAVDAYDPDKESGVSNRAEAVQTMLDGSFVIAHVAPGTYYVLASAPGYISPLASVLSHPGEEAPLGESISKRIGEVVPRLTVQANLSATVNVTLERGAAVSGTVQYDDGSPAAGMNVHLLVRSKEGWTDSPSSPFDHVNHTATTDDQGSYRISGLLPGEYVAEVQLNLTKWTFSFFGGGGSGVSSSSGSPAVSIYSGNTTRVRDAKPFALKQGEERHGEDLQIPVSKLHTVRGSMIAKHDGHVINGGHLSLLNGDDKRESGRASVAEDDDGVFQFDFVPEGNYILQVTGAADYEYEKIPNPPNSSPPFQTKRRLLHSYGPAEMPLHVEGDMSGVTVSVPDEQQQAAPPNH